jgi:hypothetical protein
MPKISTIKKIKNVLTNRTICNICFCKEKEFIQCHHLLENHNVESETFSLGNSGGCKLETPFLT